ncbi:MAG: glycosyltransferase [Pseudomonadota bacterium]
MTYNNVLIGAVVIGRNEGERLRACLETVKDQIQSVVYVDSGSTDGSVELAYDLDIEVVRLDTSIPFTAARARNQGFYQLMAQYPHIRYVQFIDGDCELCSSWVETSLGYLKQTPDVAAVCGRRYELYPDQSVYNKLCDMEWNTPIGKTKACGGDVMIRVSALQDVNGYNDALIAGEEPELCVRLREKNYNILRIDADMTLHDANMMHFEQWWKRSVRAGHAYAQVSCLHKASKKGIWKTQTRRALIWGLLLPMMILGAIAYNPVFSLALLIYPLQICRLAMAKGMMRKTSWLSATYLVIGKFAEAQGILKYYLRKMRREQPMLIEYKQSS